MIIPINVVLWFVQIQDPGVRRDVASTVLLGNNALLALDAVISWFFLQRPSRYHGWLQGLLRYRDAMSFAQDLAIAVRGELPVEVRERGWLLGSLARAEDARTLTTTISA